MDSRSMGSQVGRNLVTFFQRTLDAFAFSFCPIRWKALDVWSFIPHTLALTVSCPMIM